MREEERGGGGKSKGRERERALYRGSEGSASALVRRRYYNCPPSKRQQTRWRGVFHESFYTATRMRHEADGSVRVILVRRYTKTIFDAGEVSCELHPTVLS